MILDGGLATELEARGFDLRDPLWSARVLCESPAAVEQLHLDYLRAGADGITTGSYQATVPGLLARGVPHAAARALIQTSVRLAKRARDRFLTESTTRRAPTPPFVAASIGPYGAYLADGSEFRGDDNLSVLQLSDFHAERLELLIDAAPDVIAFETFSHRREVEACLNLLRRWPSARAWFSFVCRDKSTTVAGESARECARMLASEDSVVAIGVNCTDPRWVESLVGDIRAATSKPIAAYPNSGETFDGGTRTWTGRAVASDFATSAANWRRAGANILGGCCRVGPRHIAMLANAFRPEPPGKGGESGFAGCLAPNPSRD